MSRPEYPLGHVQVAVKCSSAGEAGREVYAASTSADKEEENHLLFERKVGYGILFHSFKGRMETADEVLRSISSCSSTSKIILRYQVSEGQCRRALQFYDHFVSSKKSRHHGLAEKPFCENQGANSASFAVAILAAAGIADEVALKEWQRHLIVPEKYIGSSTQTISPYSFALKSSTSWGENSSEGRVIDFYDPILMFTWARRQPSQSAEGQCRIVQFDMREHQIASQYDGISCFDSYLKSQSAKTQNR